MNYKKIEIKCLFHNPELSTKDREEIGDDLFEEDLLERIVYFYEISSISPRVNNKGEITGTIISTGSTEFITRLTIKEVDKKILNSSVFIFQN